MKNSYLLLLFVWMAFDAQAQNIPQAIQKAYTDYQETLPAEKIYLHTDRTLYKPGEVIWFKGYLLDGEMKPSSKSEIMFVELLNPRGTVIRKLNLKKLNNKMYNGDFQLNAGIAGGIYTIRAYTNWMSNWGEDYYFEKKITVQNVAIPKLLMKLNFEKEAYRANDWVQADLSVREVDNTFLADSDIKYTVAIGGKTISTQTMTTNDSGQVAMRFQLPNDLNTIDGLLNVMIDYEGTTESISRSIPIVLDNVSMQLFPEGGYLLHGMKNRVAFTALNEFGKPADVSGTLKDDAGKTIAKIESYHQGMGAFEFTPAKGKEYHIILNGRNQQRFELPRILQDGVGMRKTAQTKQNVSFYIHSSTAQKLYLIAEIGGKIYHRKTIESAQSGIHTFKTDDLPVGIMKLTVFDEQLRPQSERLVFVNKHRNLSIEITSNKEKYIPRESVTLQVKVTDDAGKGVKGTFSMAVVDDKLLTFIDDKQDNILSGLLMSAELRGKIFEPNFYFKLQHDKASDVAKAENALDFVMMTNGWRKFNWREILANTAHTWANKLVYTEDEFKIAGTIRINGHTVKGATVHLKTFENQRVKTNKDGNFELVAPKLDDGYYSNYIIVARYKGMEQEQQVYWNNYQYGTPKTNSKSKTEPIADNKKKEQISIAVSDDEEEEVLPSLANKTLSGKVAGIRVRGQSSVILEDKVMLSESDMMAGQLSLTTQSIAVSEIQLLGENMDEIVVIGYGDPGNNNDLVSGYYADLNVLDWAAPSLAINLKATNQQFYQGRTFYAPRYATTINGSRNQDKRKTLYWNSYLETNENGEAKVQFSCSDENSTFRAVVEGAGENGEIGHNEHTFFVESPFVVETKIPEIVTSGDKFVVSVLLKNNTDKAMTVYAQQQASSGNYFRFANSNDKVSFEIPANSFVRKEVWMDGKSVTQGVRYVEMMFYKQSIYSIYTRTRAS